MKDLLLADTLWKGNIAVDFYSYQIYGYGYY